jgi:hypothetical protein
MQVNGSRAHAESRCWALLAAAVLQRRAVAGRPARVCCAGAARVTPSGAASWARGDGMSRRDCWRGQGAGFLGDVF